MNWKGQWPLVCIKPSFKKENKKERKTRDSFKLVVLETKYSVITLTVHPIKTITLIALQNYKSNFYNSNNNLYIKYILQNSVNTMKSDRISHYTLMRNACHLTSEISEINLPDRCNRCNCVSFVIVLLYVGYNSYISVFVCLAFCHFYFSPWTILTLLTVDIQWVSWLYFFLFVLLICIIQMRYIESGIARTVRTSWVLVLFTEPITELHFKTKFNAVVRICYYCHYPCRHRTIRTWGRGRPALVGPPRNPSSSCRYPTQTDSSCSPGHTL